MSTAPHVEQIVVSALPATRSAGNDAKDLDQGTLDGIAAVEIARKTQDALIVMDDVRVTESRTMEMANLTDTTGPDNFL